MSIDWFRSWHGAPTDSKWLLIAKRAGVAPGMVSAVVWALFDHASQNEQRGNVDDFDVETYAVFSGFEEANVVSIIAALKEKAVIVSGTLSAWEKRQPKREDNSTERVREHRNAMKRNVTQGNAREDKSRIDKKEDRACAKAQRVSPDFEAFKKVYPRRSGSNPWKPAEPLFEKAIKAGTPAALLIRAAEAYGAECGRNGILDTEKIAQAQTWLRQERFSDYVQPTGAIITPLFDVRKHIV
jgi:hypothetical protein